MASRREQVLSAVFARLQAIPLVTARRNEALPASVPAGGLVILRDGDPGEPDVTLNPRTAYYSHRAEIEAFMTQPVGGGGEGELDAAGPDRRCACGGHQPRRAGRDPVLQCT